MRLIVSLSGLHRVRRGAEVALEALATELAGLGHDVVVFGSGPPIPGAPYTYRRLPVIPRERFERWPRFRALRESSTYEGLSFAPGVLGAYRPGSVDVTMSCGFPFDNLVLRRPTFGPRPRHVFVTENGDWPALDLGGESRWFSCDGLVCTNPVYFERNHQRWPSALIPNGVDAARFRPGEPARAALGLPADVSIVLMVGAAIESKRIDVGIRAVAELDDVVLVVAGDGPQRDAIDRLGATVLGQRYLRRRFAFDEMPALYRSVDVLFHPALAESFGNVYVEAMACGTPVVAHRSAITEWIVGDVGTLVDTLDDDAVVDSLRRSVGGAGRDVGAGIARVRDRFTWARVAERYESFLGEVLAAA